MCRRDRVCVIQAMASVERQDPFAPMIGNLACARSSQR
jgi:hypothetical protein